jgi:hypothetical protein
MNTYQRIVSNFLGPDGVLFCTVSLLFQDLPTQFGPVSAPIKPLFRDFPAFWDNLGRQKNGASEPIESQFLHKVTPISD